MSHELSPAKSGRSKCRACKQSIEKDSLRLGEEIPNPFSDGTATHWYHLRCGALRRPEAFLEALDAPSDEISARLTSGEMDELRSLARPGVVHHRLCRFVKVHEAPSGRARCQACRKLIEKGQLRFVLERIEEGMVSGSGFTHIDCAHEYAGAVDGVMERVEPQSELDEEQWARVKESLERQAKLPRIEPKSTGD